MGAYDISHDVIKKTSFQMQSYGTEYDDTFYEIVMNWKVALAVEIDEVCLRFDVILMHTS